MCPSIEELATAITPWVRGEMLCWGQFGCERGWGSGNAVLFVTPGSVSPEVDGRVGWIMPDGLLEDVFVEGSGSHAIFPTNQIVSTWATC